MRGGLFVGDVREGLRAFAAAGMRARTCITSPPYWGLRDYGTGEWSGGDVNCNHLMPIVGKNASSTLFAARNDDGTLSGKVNPSGTKAYSRRCKKCGATRADMQIGREETPAAFVASMVDVFRLVRDVLTDDGTLWLNLGDTYAATGGGGAGATACVGNTIAEVVGDRTRRVPPDGLKAKDLIGIPWRVALALQADGWFLRSDIIWHKPNQMPESVTDRPTKSHEYLFLLAKSASYYYDCEAIRERSVTNDPRRPYGSPGANALDPGGKQGGGALRVNVARGGFDGKTNELPGREAFRQFTEWRNRRSVWTISTTKYKDAHFATFPVALVEPCILAGSAPGDFVLDPFMGSGTTAEVAQRLGRRWAGCELNPEYAAMIGRRTAQAGLELPRADSVRREGVL